MVPLFEGMEYISTHTPHTGCDKNFSILNHLSSIFQLTHPTRGATPRALTWRQALNFNSHTPHGVRLTTMHRYLRQEAHFNSHTPHGVRLLNVNEVRRKVGISTHTPHTGCDLRNSRCMTMLTFQLTHPTRGATAFPFPGR